MALFNNDKYRPWTDELLNIILLSFILSVPFAAGLIYFVGYGHP